MLKLFVILIIAIHYPIYSMEKDQSTSSTEYSIQITPDNQEDFDMACRREISKHFRQSTEIFDLIMPVLKAKLESARNNSPKISESSSEEIDINKLVLDAVTEALKDKFEELEKHNQDKIELTEKLNESNNKTKIAIVS